MGDHLLKAQFQFTAPLPASPILSWNFSPEFAPNEQRVSPLLGGFLVSESIICILRLDIFSFILFQHLPTVGMSNIGRKYIPKLPQPFSQVDPSGTIPASKRQATRLLMEFPWDTDPNLQVFPGAWDQQKKLDPS